MAPPPQSHHGWENKTRHLLRFAFAAANGYENEEEGPLYTGLQPPEKAFRPPPPQECHWLQAWLKTSSFLLIGRPPNLPLLLLLPQRFLLPSQCSCHCYCFASTIFVPVLNGFYFYPKLP